MCKCVCIYDYDRGKYEQLCHEAVNMLPTGGRFVYERGREEGERQVENKRK